MIGTNITLPPSISGLLRLRGLNWAGCSMPSAFDDSDDVMLWNCFWLHLLGKTCRYYIVVVSDVHLMAWTRPHDSSFCCKSYYEFCRLENFCWMAKVVFVCHYFSSLFFPWNRSFQINEFRLGDITWKNLFCFVYIIWISWMTRFKMNRWIVI